MTKFISTWFYVGLLRPAPGTWGSLAALPFAFLMLWAGWGVWCLLLISTLVFVLGWWATAVETKDSDDHDPSEIVIDEIVGQWLALSPLFMMNTMFDLSNSKGFQSIEYYIFFALAFGLFRLFDIVKPWPISWADKKSTAFGVMLDDVLAGFMAALVLIALLFVKAIFL
jgi:phosphatidylglycerophosphatase A